MNVSVMVVPTTLGGVMHSRINRQCLPGLVGFLWDVGSFAVVTRVHRNSYVWPVGGYELQ